MTGLLSNSYQIARAAFTAGALCLGLAACGESNVEEQAVEKTNVSASTSHADFKRTEIGSFTIGSEDAPVTVIEYASYTCGHCAHFHEEVFPKLKEKYIDSGKVRFEMRTFSRNEPDFYASLVVDCAGEDRFEPMADLFFGSQQEWLTSSNPNEFVATLAKRAGFSTTRYEQCIADETKRKEVLSLTQEGLRKYRVNATPTLIVDGEVIDYRQGWIDLDRAIQSAL